MSKTQKILSLVLLIVMVLAIPLLLKELIGQRGLTLAKTYTWNGGGQDANWSNRDNWTPKGVPGAGSDVIFNGTNNKESLIDNEVEVNKMIIDGFTGKIIQRGKLDVKGDFYQKTGEFVGGTEMSVEGDFTHLAPGVFSAPQELTVDGGFQVAKENFQTPMGSIVAYKNRGKNVVYCGNECEKTFLPQAYLGEDEKAIPNIWKLVNPSHGLISTVSSESWIVMKNDWKWSYAFEGIEREGQNVFKANGGNVTTKDNGVYIDRGQGVQEYYLNSPDGIEQTFVIDSPQGNVGEMALVGKVKLENVTYKMNGKNSLILEDGNNQSVFSFDHLKVYDADEKEVAATMEMKERSGGEYALFIKLNDSKVRYPLTVDPVGGNPDWSSQSTNDNEWYGKFAVGMGKGRNNDVWEDIAVSKYNGGGGVYLYKGNADLKSMKSYPNADWSANGEGRFGRDLAGNGDVNGDGYNDLGIGALEYNNDNGRAYVYYGGENGMKQPSGNAAPVSSSKAVTVFEDGRPFSWFGQAMAIDGDVNGDGLNDVLIGAPGEDMARSNGTQGKAYLKLGSKTAASGIVRNFDWSASGTVASDGKGDQFGRSVAFININNDQYTDVAIGSPFSNNATKNNGVGKVDIYRGSASSPYLTKVSTLNPPARSTTIRFGWSVANAGDVNGDGYDDLAVGAHYYNGQKGAVFIYWGSSGGYSGTKYWMYQGEVAGRYLGYSVAGLGDVNGDGIDDFIASGYSEAVQATSAGKNFIFYGKKASTSGWNPTEVWGYSNNKNWQHLGYKVSYIGNVNGSGANEVAFGGYGKDDAVPGVAYIFAGKSIVPIDDQIDGAINVAVSTANPSQANWFDNVAGNTVPPELYTTCNGVQGVFHKNVCPGTTRGDDLYTSVIKGVDLSKPETDFRIKIGANDTSGIKSVKIEWVHVPTDASPNWSAANSKTCSGAYCEICAVGGKCANPVIPLSDLAYNNTTSPVSASRLFFRAVVTDMKDNVAVTGFDSRFDKFYRLVMAPAASTCSGKTASNLVSGSEPDWCGSPARNLSWSYDGKTDANFVVEVRKSSGTTILLPSSTSLMQTDSNNLTIYKDEFDYLRKTGGGGDYVWRVKAIEEGCAPTFSAWSSPFKVPAPYPAPRVSVSGNEDDTDCLVEKCDFSKPVVFDAAGSAVSVGTPKYEWFLNGSTVVESSASSFTKTFTELSGGGEVKYSLKITDGSGQACSESGTVGIKRTKPSWTEVTPN